MSEVIPLDSRKDDNRLFETEATEKVAAKESILGKRDVDLRTGGVKQINQYILQKSLGKGSFAEVFLCHDTEKKCDRAVKIFNKSLLRRKRTMERSAHGVTIVSSELDKVEREIAIMKRLIHPRLVRLYEVIDDVEEDQLYMFIEYIEMGPVMTYCKHKKKFCSPITGGICTEALAGQYLLDIADGLRHLHSNYIAHRDLKPDNVLLTSQGRIKIADFGVAHYFDNDHNNTSAKYAMNIRALERSPTRAQICETQGTYCFWAPEMVDADTSFNAYACDLWAAGICFFIFLTGKLPFFSDDGGGITELFDSIRSTKYKMPNVISMQPKRIISGLLCLDVNERLTVQDLESDTWLQEQRALFVPSDSRHSNSVSSRPSFKNFSFTTSFSSLVAPEDSKLTPTTTTRKRASTSIGTATIEAAFTKIHHKTKSIAKNLLSTASKSATRTSKAIVRRKTTVD